MRFKTWDYYVKGQVGIPRDEFRQVCLYVKGEVGISWSVLGKKRICVWPAILSYILTHTGTV